MYILPRSTFPSAISRFSILILTFLSLGGKLGTFWFAVGDLKKKRPSKLRSGRDLDVGGSLLKNGAETWGKITRAMFLIGRAIFGSFLGTDFEKNGIGV